MSWGAVGDPISLGTVGDPIPYILGAVGDPISWGAMGDPIPFGSMGAPMYSDSIRRPPHPRSPVPYGAVCPPPPALDEGRRFSHSRWLQAGAQRAARGLSVPPPTWGDRFVREQHGAERPPPPPPNETPPHPTSPSLSPQSAPRPEDPPNGTLQPSAVS